MSLNYLAKQKQILSGNCHKDFKTFYEFPPKYHKEYVCALLQLISILALVQFREHANFMPKSQKGIQIKFPCCEMIVGTTTPAFFPDSCI